MAHGLEIKHKREFHLFRWVFWLALIIATLLVAWYGYNWYENGKVPPFVSASSVPVFPGVDESVVSKQQVTGYEVAPLQSRYISIPSLGVDNTRVFPIGVDKNNQLEFPKNINDAGWYAKSAMPGSGYGAVLIDAYNSGVPKDGAFARIKTLGIGSKINLARGDGKIFTYQVVENHSMPIGEVNKTGMIMMIKSADESKEGLNLITYDGNWVPKYQQYDHRIMLRAVRLQ